MVPVILLFILLGGCAQLPEYARPRTVPNSQDLAASDGFGYRQLTLEDFKATSPPPDSTEKNSYIEARSCIQIAPAADTKAIITQALMHGKEIYVGSISEVRFEAKFLPYCSWWNPKVTGKRTAYVLQHEQIHFAIAELEAQKLSKRVDSEIADYIAFGDSVKEAQQELSKTLREHAKKFNQDVLKEHLKFDNDTSMFFAPNLQLKWLEKVESKLAEYQ